MELCDKPLHELNELVSSGTISYTDIVESVLKRINSVERELHSYIRLYPEEAINQSKKANDYLAKVKFPPSPLFGMPMALKDIVCVKDWEVTCGSKILKGFISPYDATVVEKLKNAGIIFLGQTNMDEFAMGSSTENSSYGVTRNPWDRERVPGGSSGGSASSVSSGEAIMALGTDTGGSIREPASFCGVVGLKPSYGRISRYGLVAFASSLDQIGPMTKDVMDCALVMNVIAGYDEKDSTSINSPVADYSKITKKDIKNITIGIPKEYFGKGLSADVENAIKNAITHLTKLGADILEVSLPHTEYGVSAYYIIAPSEASSNLARYDGVHYGARERDATTVGEMSAKTRAVGFGAEVKRRIMLGTYALSAGYYDAYYLKALKVRTLIKQDFEEAFEKCDFLITPTAPTPAFKIGEKVQDPIEMYLSDVLTVPVNLAGLPAVSIPCGFSEGLPIGMQIIGKPLAEKEIMELAYIYEQSTEWHKKSPFMDKK